MGYIVTEDDKFIAKIIGAALALVFMLIVISAYFEAKTFNKFTDGPKATTWDALFIELRVEAQDE